MNPRSMHTARLAVRWRLEGSNRMVASAGLNLVLAPVLHFPERMRTFYDGADRTSSKLSEVRIKATDLLCPVPQDARVRDEVRVSESGEVAAAGGSDRRRRAAGARRHRPVATPTSVKFRRARAFAGRQRLPAVRQLGHPAFGRGRHGLHFQLIAHQDKTRLIARGHALTRGLNQQCHAQSFGDMTGKPVNQRSLLSAKLRLAGLAKQGHCPPALTSHEKGSAQFPLKAKRHEMLAVAPAAGWLGPSGFAEDSDRTRPHRQRAELVNVRLFFDARMTYPIARKGMINGS